MAGPDGVFRLGGLPAGSYMLEVRAIGYVPAHAIVDLLTIEGTPNTTSVVLERIVASLDALRIIAGSADVLVRSGFTERQRSGLGHFINRAAIEWRMPFAIQDMLQSLPGTYVRSHVPGDSSSILMRDLGGLCAPKFVVDPGLVAGIEVYRRGAEAPVQFRGLRTDRCGSIVVWTDPRLARRKSAP